MGGSNTTIEAPRIGSLQVNSSAYGLVIPIVRGTTRVKGNVLWFADFRAIKHKESSGGKGGGGVTNVTYTYEAAIMLALCNGPILGVGTVWKNKEKTSIAHINTETGNQIKDILQPPAEVTLVNGETSQAVWGYLSTKHPDQAIGYTGLAYICSTRMQLSSDAGIQQLSFEILGNTATGQLDDNPKDIIVDFLSNPIYGAGFPVSKIDDLTDYGNWCTAAGLFLSPAFQEQKEAREWLAEIAQCTNSQFVWSAGKLKLVPYADAPVTGNGVTYTPNLTPVYDLDDDAFCSSGDDDPVTCSRITTADAYNHIQIEFLNRARDYNVEIAEAKDQADIEAKGLRTKDPLKLPMICKTAIARNVAQMVLQRDLYIRNIYEFRLTWKHCLLEPMDLVTITDLALGLDKAPARIIEIEEDDEGMLAVRAEEYPFGVNSSAIYPVQDTDGYLPNYQVLPGNANAPAIFEPTFRLTENNLEIWIGTSGGETWGGCEVWASRDNATYARAGIINESARHGTLVNPLPSGAAVDTVNTLRVQLADFYNNQMLSASQTEADELRTLMWVDGELIAYRDAVLVSAGVYDLSYLIRGAHNTPISSHAAGSKFARIEDDFFRYSFLPSDIGKIIYIKLVSFNIYNVANQNISDITPYTYTITGYARQRLPVDITAPPAPTVTTTANNTYPYTGHLILSWTAISGISKYSVRYKKSTDTQWKEAPVVSATTWKSPELPSGGTYDVAIAAEDEQGYLSSWTTGAQTTIPYDATAPATPGVITITPGIGFLAIQWPYNTDVDIAGYELQIAPDNSGAPGTWATVYTGLGNTHTYKGTTGSVYWARVRAFDHYPGTPKYSAYNGQTSAMVDFVRALDSANVPTGYNLQINSDFDAGTLDGWQVSQWGSLPTVVTATTPRSGKYAVRNPANTTASIQGVRMVPCNPDRAYILEAYAATLSGATGTFYLRVYFYTAAGAATTPAYLSAAEAVTPGATPTFYSKVFGAGQTDALPYGAVYMRPAVILNYNNGDRVMEAQGVRIREMIESLYVKNASMTDADILNVSAGKITSGSVTSQTITLALTEGAGDVAIKAGKTDFGDNTSGIILGMDDSDGNLPKLEIGDATNYLKYRPGTGLQVAGAITVMAGSNVQPGATNTLRYTQATDPIPLHPTFTRASTAYLNNGTQIASGKPRIEVGQFGGAIMVEEETTNLLTSPSNFGAAAWTTTGTITRVDNGDGSWTLTDSAATDGTVRQTITVANDATSRTFWVDFVKDNDETRFIELAISYSGGTTFAYGVHLDTKTGATAVRLANASGSYAVEDRGTVWRFAVTLPNNSSGNTSLLGIIRPAGGTVIGVHSDTATGSCKVMRAQLEAKPYATSFIDGTRATESLTVASIGMSPAAGTIELDIEVTEQTKRALVPSTSHRLFQISRANDAGAQGICIAHNNSGFVLVTADDSNAQSSSAYVTNANMPNGRHRFAVTWDATSAIWYVDGVQKGIIETPNLPSAFSSLIHLGGHPVSSASTANSLIDCVRLSNYKRSAAEILASATSGLPMERDAYTTALYDFNTGIEWLNNGTLKTYNGVAWEDAATWGAPTGTYVGATLAQDVESRANSAYTLVSDIASDSKLTPVEKQDIRREWDAIYSEKSSLDAQATALGITTEKTTYDNSIQALGTYLNGGTAYTLGATPPSWITDANLSVTTTIVGATFRSTFKTYYDAKIALINKMADVAATKADWSGVSGTGKPADYATKNTASSGTSPHANPQAGDTWFNSSTTDGTYYALTSYSYNGTAWIPSSPRGTYITSSGVYTGLVVADQVQTGGLRGINVNAASHTTKGSYLTQACAAGATTLYVHNTADFPTSGSGWIIDSTNDRDVISWTGKTATTLTGATGVLAHGAGVTVIPKVKNLLIDSNTNEMRFYGDPGDGSIVELASIGTTQSGSDLVIGKFGGYNSQHLAIAASSLSTAMLVEGDNYGIVCYSRGVSGIGIVSTGVVSPLALTPSDVSSAPTHTANKGSLWVTSTGVLYINTSGSTTWQKVGAQ